MSYFLPTNDGRGVFSNVQLVMDESVEYMLPQDGSGLQPIQAPPPETLMANLNNQPGPKVIILQGDHNRVAPTGNIYFLPPGVQIAGSTVVAQTQDNSQQALEALLQTRKKQQNVMRTLNQIALPQAPAQPRPQLSQKNCSEELARMLQMHQDKVMCQTEGQQVSLMNVDVTKTQQASETKPQSVDASVGTDSPLEVKNVSPKFIFSSGPRPRGAQPATVRPTARVMKQPSTPGRSADPVILYRVMVPEERSPVSSTSSDQLQLRGNQSPVRPFGSAGPESRLVRCVSPMRTTIYQRAAAPRVQSPRSSSPIRHPGKNTPSPSTRQLRPTRLSTPNFLQILRPPQPVSQPSPPKSAVVATENVDEPSSTSEIGLSTSPCNKEPMQEIRTVKGFLAICPFCGFSNVDFDKCERCKRKLPDGVKRQPINPVNTPQRIPIRCNLEMTVLPDSMIISKAKNQQQLEMSKVKKVDEPEILLLSSDEEDNSPDSNLNESCSKAENVSKEPVYSAEDRLQIQPEPNIHVPDEPAEPFTMMILKSLRVGNYVAGTRKPVYISADGIHFVGPSAIYGTDVKIFIKKASIKAVLIHYGEKESMLMIYPTRNTAIRIRNLLDINNENLLFYDPCSNVQAFRRLILFVERVTDEHKIVLSNVLSGLISIIDDVDQKSLMTCVHEIIQMPPADGKLLIFNNFEISRADYACLAVESYINDLIIDFYIQYLYERKLSATDKARTHIFSTFFYNRLTETREEESSKDRPAEKRHKRVKKWTRKINIFEKDFIIIPINENSHWFLAVICFPYLTGQVRFKDNTPISPDASPTKPPQRTTMQIGNTTITHCRSKNDSSDEGQIILPSSDRDEAEAEDVLSETEGDPDESISNPEPPQQEIPLLGNSEPEQSPVPKSRKTEPIKQPCILIFDSLRGSGCRARVVATLRDYLTVEYKAKTGRDRTFNKKTIKGSIVKVPQQDNYSDCGLFVLQYVESFFENPLTDFNLPIRYLHNWFGENIHNKRKEVAELIQSLMIEQGSDPNLMNLPDLTARTQSMCDEIEEDADMELEDDEKSDEGYTPEDNENVENSSQNEEEALTAVEAAPQEATITTATGTTATTTQLSMVRQFLPGHGPADGQTRQTLKSIRIHRPATRIPLDSPSETKKFKNQ